MNIAAKNGWKIQTINNIETSLTLSNGLKLDLPQRDPEKPRDSLVDEYTFTVLLIGSRTAPDYAAGRQRKYYG